MCKYSIIIPVKSVNTYIRETVPYIQNLRSQNWELIILPNEQEPDEWGDQRIKIIASGKFGPATKRDIGAKFARGEILVFLDDDSYPNKDILEIATKYFEDPDVVAIGGPGVTPSTDSFLQRASGAVFLSKITGGAPERYTSLGKTKQVDDWPSVNFMVRKHAFLEVGGFNSPYWPGEDTLFCLKLKQRFNNQILYVPELVVYHHRRASLYSHLKQVSAYGKHRGFFAHKFPENSFRIKYFVPSAFVVTLGALAIYGAIYGEWNALLIYVMIYLLVIMVGALEASKIVGFRVAIASTIYTILTHIAYGYNFIVGYCKNDLKSRLR